MIKLIKLPIDPIEMTEQTPFLAEWFPNIFAEVLVPINPRRWPAYLTGSAMASEMPEFVDKLQTPFNKLIVATEYLATSKSDIQWRDRFWEVLQDTTTINISCEMGGDFGSFGAGAMAEKIANRYVDEMIGTSITLRNTESLNERLYKEAGRRAGLDVNLVKGTGTFRQFVNPKSRGNTLNRPPRGSRPLWAKKSYNSVITTKGRGPLGFVIPLLFNERSALQLSKRLLSEQSYGIVKETVGIYCYFRYVKFIYKIGKKGIPILDHKIKPKILSLKRKFRKKTPK